MKHEWVFSKRQSWWRCLKCKEKVFCFGDGGKLPDSECPVPEAPLTPIEAARRMRAIASRGDEERSHIDGDDILMEIARHAGFGEAVEVFDDMVKWFA